MQSLVILILSISLAFVKSQDTAAADSSQPINFKCPEKNGFFADREQCDLYYECVDNVPTPKLCPDGLLFEDGNPNHEKCDYPFNVDCGVREFVQEPETGIDARCYRANGFFNHEDEVECSKFYNCVNGVAYELPCATGLIFDEAQGTCVREEQASEYAKKCEKKKEKETIAGFACPDAETIGPHGQPLAHPSFPHPTSCQKFITCYFGKDIRELGCMKGQVFDHNALRCKTPEDGPLDCKCWYECPEDSQCPDSCRSDCTCPTGDEGN